MNNNKQQGDATMNESYKDKFNAHDEARRELTPLMI